MGAHKIQLASLMLFCLIPSLQLLCENVGRKERVCTVPPLQFGEIYERTKPKSVRVYTQREFGRRDLRSSVWVIIQSSCSHISHFESHRLWERTDLSYTQVAHVQAPKSKEKQKQHTLTNSYSRCFFLSNFKALWHSHIANLIIWWGPHAVIKISLHKSQSSENLSLKHVFITKQKIIVKSLTCNYWPVCGLHVSQTGTFYVVKQRKKKKKN